jgi:hypothetical protein
VSRKYVPPLRVRPQGTTREGYLREIAELRELLPAAVPFMRFWIERRVAELAKELEKLK